MTQYARPVLVVVFLLMLATPALIRHYGPGAPAAAAARLIPTRGTGSVSPKCRGRPAWTSSTKLRPSTRSSRTSCRRSPPWGRRSPSWTWTPTAIRTSMSPTAARARRTACIATAATAPSKRSPTSSASPTSIDPNRCVDGRGVRRLRQRRLRGPAPLSLGAARTLSQRGRAPVHARHRDGRPLALGQHQRGGVARLRRRRAARPLSRGLLPRAAEPLAARDHEDDARELRVREQRRTAVPLPQPGRRPVRGGQREGRPGLLPLGAGRRRRGPARHGLPRHLHRQRLRRVGTVHQRGGAVPRSRPRHRRGLCAEERDERVGRRRAQPGPPRDLRLEHLRRRHPHPGQQPLGPHGAAQGAAGLREPGARHGDRPRRLELGRAVRRSEQRWLSRSLSRERVRLRLARRELLVRLLQGGRRTSGRDRGRRELAGHGAAQPRGLSAEESLGQRRRRPVRGGGADGRRVRPLRRPGGRAGGFRGARRPRRRRGEPARATAALPE
jgi:hypothetical protein